MFLKASKNIRRPKNCCEIVIVTNYTMTTLNDLATLRLRGEKIKASLISRNKHKDFVADPAAWSEQQVQIQIVLSHIGYLLLFLIFHLQMQPQADKDIE